MNNSVAQLCGLVSGLLTSQLAEWEIDDYSRGQIAAAINILENVGRFAIWSPELAAKQIGLDLAALQHFKPAPGGLSRLEDEIRAADAALPGDVFQIKGELDAIICQLVEKHFEAGQTIPDHIRAGNSDVIFEIARSQIAMEKASNVRPTMNEISGKPTT
jgi:hypothetical protein